MHGKASHVVGAAIGLIAAGALWYLPMRSAQDLDHIAIFDAPGPFGVPPPSTSDSIVAAAVLAGAALIAGLPLLAVGLSLVLAPAGTSQAITSYILGGQPLSIGQGQSVALGAYLLFGGMLVVSAALPWRWRKPGTVPEADTGPATDLASEAMAG
jgi:hypothetical protein